MRGRLTVRESGGALRGPDRCSPTPLSPSRNRATPDPGRSSRGPLPTLPSEGKGSTPAQGKKDSRGSAQSQARGPGAPAPPAAPARGLAPPRGRGRRGPGRGRRALPGPAGERRPPPSPACRAPAARGLTASTACCRMEVNLENILSRDCSSLSRDDLESSSIRRRRPCCGCRGRSRVKAGAGRGAQAEGRSGPGRAASGVSPRRGGSGGRWDVAGGEEGVPRGLWAPRRSGGGGGGSGSDTVAAPLKLLPPALPAAACRGRRRGPGRPRQAGPALPRGGGTPRGREKHQRPPPAWGGSPAWAQPPTSPADVVVLVS